MEEYVKLQSIIDNAGVVGANAQAKIGNLKSIDDNHTLMRSQVIIQGHLPLCQSYLGGDPLG